MYNTSYMMNSGNKQHYLLSAKARTFSLLEIARLSDDDAFDMFKDARWPEGVKCPKCDGSSHYWLETRKQWRCKCWCELCTCHEDKLCCCGCKQTIKEAWARSTKGCPVEKQQT